MTGTHHKADTRDVGFVQLASGLQTLSGDATDPAALVVDLDGTLVRTDTLWETFVQMLAERPLTVFLVPFWLIRGRSYLKARMAEQANVDVAHLPYCPSVLKLIEEARAEGRPVVLATAAHSSIAEAVAGHLDVFDGVIASDSANNLKGSNKAKAIVKAFDTRPFDYVGDSYSDGPIWALSRRALAINPSGRLRRKYAQLEPVNTGQPAGFRVAVKAMRLHQWSKNLLLFVPLFMSHQFSDLAKLSDAVLAALCLSLVASATYIWNDLLDLAADRRHISKKTRPLAAGDLTIVQGIALSTGIFAAGLSLAAYFLSPTVSTLLLGYVALTLSYSLFFKRKLVVDVLILAGLYTYRIWIGAETVDVQISSWLFAFSIFFFLSLAFLKRYVDLADMPPESDESMPGRGYFAADLDMVRTLGPVSGYLSILVMALYISSPEVKQIYQQPDWLWVICAGLVYWVSRLWFLAQRNEMPPDPIAFAVRDLKSLYIAAAILTAIVLANL